MPEVIVNGRDRVVLDKSDVIGQGGEAIIYRLGRDKAIKMYRDMTPVRVRKLTAFLKAGFKLPSNIIYPMEPVTDRHNSLLGFTMLRLSGAYDPIAVLGNRGYCTKNSITVKDIVAIFLQMASNIVDIHGQSLVVGDLNDQNETIHSIKHDLAWLDVDSWQYGPFPCMVGTEGYLSPDLYGIDLSKAPAFKPEHDWYSFTVLLFRSLLRLHPFRAGFHPKYRSLLLRASKGVTVLDAGITKYPPLGLPPEVLSDDLVQAMLDTLKRKHRGVFPVEELETLGEILVECPKCHIWYCGTREHCPGCQEKNLVDMRLAARVAGCTCEDMIVTQGHILYFQLVDTTVYCIADEGGLTVLYKKSKGHNVVRKELFKTTPGAKFGFFNNLLVVCAKPHEETPDLFILEVSGAKPKPLHKRTTESFAGGRAVFGCSAKYIYRIAGPRLVRDELFNGSTLATTEVAQTMPNQTWFSVDPNPPKDKEVIFGLFRVFGEFQWFLIVSDERTKTFTRFQVNLPSLLKTEALHDISVRFAGERVIVLRKTRKRGEDFVHVSVVRVKDGSIKGSTIVKVMDNPLYDTIHGKAFDGSNLIHPSADGLVQEDLKAQQKVTLKATDQYINGDESVVCFGASEFIVVRHERILLITPNK